MLSNQESQVEQLNNKSEEVRNLLSKLFFYTIFIFSIYIFLNVTFYFSGKSKKELSKSAVFRIVSIYVYRYKLSVDASYASEFSLTFIAR